MRAQSRAVAIVAFGVVDLLLFVFELREISLGKVAIRCPKTRRISLPDALIRA
jgi:hypothetical protein